MSFYSASFAMFFAAVVMLYYVSPQGRRVPALLAASALFYISFNPQYIFVLLALIAVDYCAGLLIERAESSRAKSAWLALSLASYTLAGAMWGFLLPRLRPSVGTVVLAQRHYLCGPDRGLTDPLHLALGRAQEERLARLFATAEGVLIAFMTPVLGVLIDFYGSVDRVLVLIGLCFLLGLTMLALIAVVRSLKHPQHKQFTQSALRGIATCSWRVDNSPAWLAW